MFSRSIFVTFLTLALSVQALPQRQQQCPAVSTVIQVRTVTVTATPSLNEKNGGSGQTKTTSSRNPEATPPRQGGKNNNGPGVAKPTPSTSSTRRGGNKTTSVAATTPARGKNNNNNGTKTSSVAATTTQRGNKGGGGDKNNNGTKTSSSAAATTTAAKDNGGNNGNNNGDPQKSTTLDPRVIAPGFANDGQDVPTAGQVPSLTSKNNFINFCLTVPNLPITNGKQITTGSCNPAPIGVIPSIDNMPSSKFTFPANFGTIKAGQTFTIKMAIKNMQTGFFVNAQANYFAAPQQLNSKGQIQGHSHVVVEQLSAIDQTTPTDPKKFAFFKGLNAAAQGGELTADVPNGLQPGFYKLSSINTAANHQPVIVPVAQHGCLDDSIYFTVTADGQPSTGAGGGKNASPATGASQPPPAASSAASTTVSAKASPSAVVKDGAPAKGTPAASTPSNTNTGNTTGGRGKNNVGDNAGGGGTTPTPSSSSTPATSSTAATRPATKGGRQRRGLSRMA
jgi:hypothetical protein